MKQFIEETKEKYLKLKNKELELVNQEEEQSKQELVAEMEFYEINDKTQTIKRRFFRKTNELQKKKNKFENKKCRNCVLTVGLSYIIPIIFLKLFFDTLILHLIALIVSTIIGLITAIRYSKNYKTKHIKEFEEQEEIIKLKKEIENLKEQYNKEETILNQKRNILKENRQKTEKLRREIESIRNSIRLLQHNTYENLLGITENIEKEQNLTLNK